MPCLNLPQPKIDGEELTNKISYFLDYNLNISYVTGASLYYHQMVILRIRYENKKFYMIEKLGKIMITNGYYLYRWTSYNIHVHKKYVPIDNHKIL